MAKLRLSKENINTISSGVVVCWTNGSLKGTYSVYLTQDLLNPPSRLTIVGDGFFTNQLIAMAFDIIMGGDGTVVKANIVEEFL